MLDGLRILALSCLLAACAGCRSQSHTAAPLETRLHAADVAAAVSLSARSEGTSSFLYIRLPGQAAERRVTGRNSGWEANPVLSPDGVLVAYTLASGAEAKSEVWVTRLADRASMRVSVADEDALMPVFGADARTLFYVISQFNGHYSPIAWPRRHKFDIKKVSLDAKQMAIVSAPVELTHQQFFDLLALSVSRDGTKFLISTSAYPIGSIIEEYDLSRLQEQPKIFQPHVPSEPREGAEIGSAAYSSDGTEIYFAAATEGKDGMFNYNVYRMSEVTGAEVVQLTHRTGMLDGLSVRADGVHFWAGAKEYLLNPATQALREL